MFMSFLSSQSFQLLLMLICIAVVSCVFIRQYSKGNKDAVTDIKIHKLHTFYVSGILVFIIIELVTGLCMSDSNHSDILSYVTFGATLSSLIMSVVAIIFTIVTSNRGEEQYKKIDSASERVTESLGQFMERTDGIDKSVSAFKETSGSIVEKMNAILDELNGIKNDMSDLKRIAPMLEGSKAKVSSPEEQGKHELDALAVRFVTVGSFSGNMALYACVLSKDSQKEFSIKDIDNQDDFMYKFGYLVAAVATGFIGGNISMGQCQISFYYEPLKKMLKEAIDKYIAGQTAEIREQIKEYIQHVEDLFS